jgi:hypothetical protein
MPLSIVPAVESSATSPIMITTSLNLKKISLLIYYSLNSITHITGGTYRLAAVVECGRRLISHRHLLRSGSISCGFLMKLDLLAVQRDHPREALLAGCQSVHHGQSCGLRGATLQIVVVVLLQVHAGPETPSSSCEVSAGTHQFLLGRQLDLGWLDN